MHFCRFQNSEPVIVNQRPDQNEAVRSLPIKIFALERKLGFQVQLKRMAPLLELEVERLD